MVCEVGLDAALFFVTDVAMMGSVFAGLKECHFQSRGRDNLEPVMGVPGADINEDESRKGVCAIARD
jgi:hypothetical protein